MNISHGLADELRACGALGIPPSDTLPDEKIPLLECIFLRQIFVDLDSDTLVRVDEMVYIRSASP